MVLAVLRGYDCGDLHPACVRALPLLTLPSTSLGTQPSAARGTRHTYFQPDRPIVASYGVPPATRLKHAPHPVYGEVLETNKDANERALNLLVQGP